MKIKKIDALESYIKTENKHWNEFVFEMLCEVLQQGRFENPETPLQLFSNAIEIFTKHHEHPLKAVQLFNVKVNKLQLNSIQKIFIYEWVCEYLTQFEFDCDLTPISDLLKSQREKLKGENESQTPQIKNIRETLKEMVQKEFETLPDTLKTLEPVQRLNIVCKLIPFVLPKIESITHEQ